MLAFVVLFYIGFSFIVNVKQRQEDGDTTDKRICQIHASVLIS